MTELTCPLCLGALVPVPGTCPKCGASVEVSADAASTEHLPLMPKRKVPRLDVHHLLVQFATKAPDRPGPEHRPVPTMLILLEAGDHGTLPVTWAVLN